MKHKNIILALSALLLVLICIKVLQPSIEELKASKQGYEYPIHIEANLDHSFASDRRVRQSIKDAATNIQVNPLFFCYGSPKMFGEKKKYPDYVVRFEEKDIPASIEFDYSNKEALKRVDVRIRRDDYQGTREQLIAKLGNQYIEWGELNENGNSILWFFPDYYVYYNHSHILDDLDYITIATYGSAHKDYNYIYKYGICGESTFFTPPTKNTTSSSKKTYKYGDSDTYMGSSKQKEDLKAIDEYFGF